MKRARLEVRVWREPGFEDGDVLTWRAQVWENRKKAVSRVGVGRTDIAALNDCLAMWRTDQERAARDAETVKWVPVSEPV